VGTHQLIFSGGGIEGILGNSGLIEEVVIGEVVKGFGMR